jgi:hypothetical protein
MALHWVRTARSPRARRRPAWLAGWVTLLAATPCLAQAGDGPAAEVLFQEGRKALDAGDYQEASQKFAESQRLDPAAGTLMNLATCEEKLGKLATAWQHWKEAIDSLQPADARTTFARQRVQSLEKRLPHLTVSLAAGGEGARLFRDDVELGTASQGVALPVDPGPHTVTVQAAGHRPESKAFSMTEGEEKKVELHAPNDSDSASDAEARAHRRTLGWALGGAGIVGVGTALVTGILLNDKKSTVETDCPNKMCRSSDGVDAADSGPTLLVVNGVAWVIGAAGLGLGAYFVLANAPPSTASAGFVPSFDRNGASLSYRGSF